MKRWWLAAAGGSTLALFLTGGAQALNNRTWVSGAGTDQAGCGPIASPCRTMQYAHDNTSPGGEIDVKDAAGYGALTITKAISIFNEGVGTAGLIAATGNVVTVNAGANDLVVLRGMTVEGLNSATNGIAHIGGGQLVVDRCTIGGFPFAGAFDTGNGILVRPTSHAVKLSVSDSLFTNNGFSAVLGYPAANSPAVTINVDRITAVGNRNGVGGMGIYVPPGVLAITVTRSTLSQNISYGAWLQGSGKMTLGDLVISRNDVGISNASMPNGMYSFGNNMVVDNTTDVYGASPFAKSMQ